MPGAQKNTHDPDGALMRAVVNYDKAGAKESLESGADPNVTDKNGLTALMWAAGGGRLDLVLLLLAAGADVRAASDMGRTALMFAAQAGRTEIVAALLAARADAGARDENGLTALQLAERHGRDEVVRLLQ